MAEPKRRDRPKGYEIRDSLRLKPMQKKPSGKGYGAQGALGATAAATAADMAGATDPYLSRNEFKPGFYDQKDKPPITAETMYGKGTTRTLESPMIDPDTSMMQNMAEGGSVRGQKNIQVKKKPFRGIF